MLILSLLIAGIIFALLAAGVISMQSFRVKRGTVELNDDYDGPKDVSRMLIAVFRFGLKRSVYLRKFIMQYVAHLAVRVMFYFDKFSSYLYARSRNWFVKNAVRNKGTVPHFWQHLKVYKQEMDQKKKKKEESK